MKITLITVCFNSEKTIKDTLESVLHQTFTNYEYIIVDGKSKDNTLKIIEEYIPKFKGKITLISEKDKGLYDAMNKGIKLAQGDIVGILNSDDILANRFVFQKIIDTFKETNCDGTYSDLLFMSEALEKPTRNFIAHNYTKHFGWHPPHPTLYIKKKIYQEIGNFNIKYRICADLDFMTRLIKKEYKLEYMKKYLIIMRSGGVSTDGLKGYTRNLKEANEVLKNNNIKFYSIINLIRIFKTMKQGISAKWFKKRILQRLARESKE